MNVRCLRWLLVIGLSGAGVAPVRADAPPVTVYPQWMTTFWRDVLADDHIAASPDPTWARLPDGHTVLVSMRGNALLLRRFAADGAVRDARWESLAEAGIGDNATDVVVRFDAPGHGLWVLAGTAGGACQVLRLEADLRRVWSVPAPGSTPYGNRCRGLYVLPDGSAVVARQTSLFRIDASGQVRWMVNNGDGGRFLQVNDFALDTNGTIWVAGHYSNEAAVLRFDADGALLSADEFHCTRCVASQAKSIAVAPDGSVAVGGGSGSFQPGFLARYAADGSRVLLVDTADDVAYAQVAHDASGAIYVLATMRTTPAEIRRVDAASGAVLWTTAAGDDFATMDGGVVVTRKSMTGIVAIALDAAGNALWTRPLSSSPTATVSRGFARNGVTELLLRDPSQASPDCGSAPQLLALDGSGAIAGALRACTMPAAARLQEVDALAGVGVLVNLGHRLISYTPEGVERWRATRCELCGGSGPGDRRWVAAALTADGGAWAVAAEPPSSGLPGATTVQRIESDGHSSFSAPAAAGATAYAGIRLLGTTQEAVMLHAAPMSGVTWQRVRGDGSAPLVRNYPVPDDFFHIDAMRRLDDGGLTLVVKGDVICSVGCPPRYVTALRLAADGGLRWRYQFPEPEAMISLGADGSAMAVLPWMEADGLLRLRTIGADGQVGASLPLAELPPYVAPAQLSGPVDGHWLLRTDGGFPWENALWLIDATGHVAASQRDGLDAWTHSANAFGYLLSELRADDSYLVLRDPVSLAVQAQFVFGGSGSASLDFDPWRWRLLDDGGVYGTVLTSRAGLVQRALARYSVPGGPPANLLFRDSFD